MKIIETSNTPPENVEQAADLAALTAAANDAPPVPGAPVQEPEPLKPDLASEIEAIIMMTVATLGPMFPSLKETYTAPVTGAASQSIAAVCNKHGWLQNGMMGQYGEELACLAIVGPLAYSTYTGIKADLAAKQPKAEQPKIEAQPATTKTVQFGTAVPEGTEN